MSERAEENIHGLLNRSAGGGLAEEPVAQSHQVEALV
jgi:hypothetical protein